MESLKVWVLNLQIKLDFDSKIDENFQKGITYVYKDRLLFLAINAFPLCSQVNTALAVFRFITFTLIFTDISSDYLKKQLNPSDYSH